MNADVEGHVYQVPTYDGDVFGERRVPVLVKREQRGAYGLDVVLGYGQEHASCVYFERRESGWAIVITPPGTDDTSAIVYVMDDGRTIVEKTTN